MSDDREGIRAAISGSPRADAQDPPPAAHVAPSLPRAVWRVDRLTIGLALCRSSRVVAQFPDFPDSCATEVGISLSLVFDEPRHLERGTP